MMHPGLSLTLLAALTASAAAPPEPSLSPVMRDVFQRQLADCEAALLSKPRAAAAPRLGTAAHAAFELGRFEKARAYAHHGLEAVDALSPGMAKALGGESVFYGHLVLGRLALMDGDAYTARKELILAATSNGSPVLKTFGPNMRLAYDLLTRPESTEEDRKAVIAFFEGCERFWDDDVLDEWIDIVESGNIPRFSPTLLD